jgi:hypothetical protein
LQHFVLQHEKMRSSKVGLQQVGLQQVGFAQQLLGAAQVGSQAGLQQLAGAAQVGSQHLDLQHFVLGQQLLGAAHVGSQAGAAEQHLGASQQVGLQQRTRFSRPQPVLQQGCLQQLGAAEQHEGAQAGAQAGAALQQGAGSQHEGLLQHLVSQQLLVQPHPLAPNIRSRSSNPKPWVQVAKPSTNEPRIMFHFIDRTLLYREYSNWRFPGSERK